MNLELDMTDATTPVERQLNAESTSYDMNSFINNTNCSSSFPPGQVVFLPCDNPRNIISAHAAEVVDLVVFAGFFPVLVTFGVIANVINMAVFAQQGLSDRINLCLFSLAVSDTGFLLSVMAGKSYAAISLVDTGAGDYWHQAHHGPVLGAFLGFMVLSNVITTVIAVERCICVISPLKAARIFRTKYMAAVIAVIAVYVLAAMVTCLTLKYRTVQVSDPLAPNTTSSLYVSRLTPLYLRHRTLIDVIYNTSLLVIVPLTSFVVVIACNVTIVVHLRVAAAWRRGTVSAKTSSAQELSVTRMLVTVCCVYVICMTPSVTRSLLLLGRVPGFLNTGYLCNAFKTTVAMNHLMEVVNASCNFFMYVKQSSRYRSTLRQICRCGGGVKCQKKKP